MRIRSISTFIAGFCFVLVAYGADSQFESGLQKTHLLELFTSEGCSSCPSAEAWLSKLKAEPRLWKDFVPIAFHVDYWDRLGWRDPFAAKEWTARQYQYSAVWKSDSVYTPGFVLDGREWQNTAIPSATDDAVGVLKVSFDKEGRLLAEFHLLKGDAPKFDFHVALLGFDLKTNVTGGENNGRKLQHDFVVLSLASEKMSDGKSAIKPERTRRANQSDCGVGNFRGSDRTYPGDRRLAALRSPHRSTSPITISMLPRMTMTSATVCPRQRSSSTVRLMKLGGRTR